MRAQQQPKARDIAAALAARIDALSADLLGEPNRALSSARERRWGRRGSLAVVMAGDQAGAFYDHEQGRGGGVLDLIVRERQCSFIDALRWASGWLGGTAAPVTRPVSMSWRREIEHVADLQERQRRAAAIWAEARDPAGTPVETYLRKRGLQLVDTPDLKFHPECPRGRDRVPAMVALMRDPVTTEAIGVHRTFINFDGTKAKRDEADAAKAMLGAAGVVMLTPSADVTSGLFLTEGIENCLAALLGDWAPCWAASSAGGIANFPVLAGIEALTVLADADAPGRAAAERCAQRWADAGREASVIEPTRPGADLNDLLREGAT
jgi:putative DNA primase/helicase